MAQRRVLVINYYWPPASDVGVLRTLKFVKYLREYGWEPVVFTAANAQYALLDHSTEKDIPEGLEVLRGPILEPQGIYQLLKGKKAKESPAHTFYFPDDNPGLLNRISVWVRANFFIPDARALWIKPSVRLLKRYLKENPVDVVFTSGPPQSNTRIGVGLKKSLGIPWLADWRDPWTQVDYFRNLPLTSWAERLHKKWNKKHFN